MKHKIYFFFAICTVLLSVCSLWFFRIVPVSRMWDAYNVVFVDINCEIDTVRMKFSDAQIEGVLYPDHSDFPISNTFTPAHYNDLSSDFTYEQLQNAYFYDRDKKYYLYYVPEKYERSVQNALEDFPYAWGIDFETTIPAIPPLVMLIFTLILFYFCKNKLFFASLQFPFVLFCIAVPFYHIVAFACLYGYAVFIIQKYWNRQFFVKQLFKHGFLLSSFVLLVAVSILSGIRVFFLFFLTLLISVSLIYIIIYIKRWTHKRSIFNPIPIHSAKTISVSTILNFRYALIPAFCVVFVSFFAFLNIQPSIGSAVGLLYIPGPSEYTVTDDFSTQSYEEIIKIEKKDRLPDLSDFMIAAWHMDTYPYIKLDSLENSVVLPGESVAYSTYVKNGYALEEQIVTVAVFNDDYITQVLTSALNTVNAGAEKLLTSQKGFLRVNYSNSESAKSPTGAPFFLICACVYILSLLAYLKIKKG